MSVKLGSKVKDSITGFYGIAISRTEYLHGCVHVGIQPTELHEGKTILSEWFDEQRVEVIEEKPPEVSPASSAYSGGPASPTGRVHR